MGEAKRRKDAQAASYREAEAQLQRIANYIENQLPPDILFALCIFGKLDSKYGGYVSNAHREDMVKALRECADNLEAKFDVPPGEPIPGVDTEPN